MRLSPSTLFRTSLALSTLGAFTYSYSFAHAHSSSPNHPLNPNQSPLRMSSSDPQNQSPTIATSSSPILLSDSLSAQRPLTLFSSLARSVPLANSAFSQSSSYTIVLAPVNSALKDLKQRPWEDASEGEQQVHTKEEGVERADRNLRAWVQGYLVQGEKGAEWKEGEKRWRGANEGKKEVWWEVDAEGRQVVKPEGIVVRGVVSRVANGEVWALEGTLGK